jgi:ectoine hydroxylase
MTSILNEQTRQQWQQDGYLFVRGLFDRDEIALLRGAIETDPQIRSSFFDRHDAQGKATRVVLWNHPGDSVYGLAARSERVVDTMQEMLGGEVYHYHSKLTAKEAFEGGAWEWHQDYGYWYNNGCVWPTMASVMVALDRSTRANGCLQVLRGSHLAGRVDHVLLPGNQVGADLVRVEQMKNRMELVYCELEPGDALFFHCNLMHRSDQNRSPDRRWTVLFCYNAARNNPYLEHHHPQYTPLIKVPDAAVKQAGLRYAVGEDANFRKAVAIPPELKKTA